MLAPLAGFTVGVTADRRSEEQVELLRRRGGRVLLGPSIRTVPHSPHDRLRTAIEAVVADPPDFVVLTTGMGARGWFDAADSLGLGSALLGALRQATVLARGPKAAGAAVAAGLEVAWRAPSDRSEELVAHLAGQGVAGRRVAVQLDGRDDPVLGDALSAQGWQVVDVPVYRWTRPEDTAPARRLIDAACERRLDAVTFTTSPALGNLLDLAAELGRDDDLRAAFDDTVVATCVGPVCAESAARLGITRTIQPARPRLGAMVQALAAHLAGRARALVGGETTLVVQGSLAVVDGREVELADRERAVLDALAERPGVVVSKAALVARVWGTGEVDEHAVEVTVARLRRRLGPAGGLIATTPRRGYRLVATPGPPPT